MIRTYDVRGQELKTLMTAQDALRLAQEKLNVGSLVGLNGILSDVLYTLATMSRAEQIRFLQGCRPLRINRPIIETSRDRVKLLNAYVLRGVRR